MQIKIKEDVEDVKIDVKESGLDNMTIVQSLNILISHYCNLLLQEAKIVGDDTEQVLNNMVQERWSNKKNNVKIRIS